MKKSLALKRTKARSTNAARPESQEPLRERILNAAFSSFMEKGYAATSTLEIATRAKVSKRDLYGVCADKSELLVEAITERARRMRLPLELPVATDREALKNTLIAFGLAILRGVCEKPVLALYRLAIAESGNAPEVAKTLESSREVNRAALSRTLAQAQADGFIRAGDSKEMAADFIGLLWGNLLLQLLLRVSEPPSAQVLERKAGQATEKFLNLYGRADR